jgi:indolepyruvate ferredoxin oxidoreductase
VLLAALTPANAKTITEIARLPDEVRGFGHVKAASVETMAAKRKVLMAGL